MSIPFDHWISCASKITKTCSKLASKLTESNGLSYEENFETCLALEIERMKLISTVALQLQDDYADEVAAYGNGKCRAFWITVRPKPDVSFETFYKTVYSFANRIILKQYTMVFEQKGVDMATMGHGFHMHMAVKEATWRSKCDALRDTKSTFAHVCPGGQGVTVDPIRKEKDLAANMKNMLEWASKDGHKIVTKEMDIAWRESLGLEPFYEVGGLSSTHGPKDSPGIPPPPTTTVEFV